jgi:hypothetical protein
MRSMKITEASDEELRLYARDSLGLEIHPKLSRANTLAKISAAKPDVVEITLVDLPQPQMEKRKRNSNDDGRGTVRLIIHTQEGDGGDKPIELGCNGKFMKVPRGAEVELPYRFYEVLNNAVRYQYENAAGDKGLDPTPRRVHQHPFSILRMPEQAKPAPRAEAAAA